MLQIQMRILRVFGLSKAEMNSIIENAQAEGSPSLRLQERDGEYLVCVQASAPTQAMADEYCEKVGAETAHPLWRCLLWL